MKIFVTTNSVGKPTAFYTSKDNTDIPETAFEISSDVRDELIACFPRKGYVDGVVVDLDDSVVFELTKIKENKLAEINSGYERAVAVIKSGVPSSEVDTWTKQEAEARAYLADSSATTPLIDALAESRGVEKDDLVLKIIAKADAYASAMGKLTGLRQKYEDLYNAATTATEYVAIDVQY